VVLEKSGLENGFEWKCPYGQPGDRLWVRETWGENQFGETHYRADAVEPFDGPEGWKPSIHMHRHRSRILLEIVTVRVERLQDISDLDVLAEGVEIPPTQMYDRYNLAKLLGQRYFQPLWDSINGRSNMGKPGPHGQIEYLNLTSWRANPWVWVVEFKRVQPA